MKKEKFIKKVLNQQFGKYFVENFPYRYDVEIELIKKAMKFHNWNMFFYGFLIGLFINIIADFIIL